MNYEILPPSTPNFAKLKYPKEIQTAITEMNSTHSEWAEQDTSLAELKDDLDTAKQTDALALRAAAIAGEPDPGTANTQAAERAILYQHEKTKYARNQAQKAGQLVTKLIKENQVEVIDLSIAAAAAGIEKFRQEVAAIQDNYEVLVKARHEALEGIVMIGRLGITKDLIQFEPHFPVGGNLVVPNSREDRLLGIMAVLTRLFHPEDVKKPKPDLARVGTTKPIRIQRKLF